MNVAACLSNDIGVAAACQAVGIARATFYRHNSCGNHDDGACGPGRNSPLALTIEQRATVIELLHSGPIYRYGTPPDLCPAIG